MIKIQAEIEMSDLADRITEDYDVTRNNYTKLLDFIEAIDMNVNDIQFTVALRDMLNDVIEAEQA